MSKIRVYELAKLLGKSNPELVETLRNMGVEIKTHMSSIDMETATLVEKKLTGEDLAAEETSAKEQEHSKAASRPKAAPGGVIVADKSSTVGDIARKIGKSPSEAVKILIDEGFMIPASATPDDD
ncbi:MAG: translation initiation factor IF-2 N-terminal domain-containing protein, partial [Synergistaceae bacterium]|nr:translation initiation factor IF-2 N-terminal domain-containing protein [Synergistaceae bacterium]